MAASDLVDDVLLALFYLETPQKAVDLDRLFTVEPFYLHSSADVQIAIQQLCKQGLVEEIEGRLASRVPFERVRGLLLQNEEIQAAVSSLSEEEVVALEAVMCQQRRATKQDLEAYGFYDRKGDGDSWRLADVTRSLGKKRLVVETLNSSAEVVFVVPSVILGGLRKAHRSVRDSKLLPARRLWMQKLMTDTGVIRDSKIRSAFEAVPHDMFLPDHVRHLAYSGASIDIESSESEWRADLSLDGWGILTEKERHDQSKFDERQFSESPGIIAAILSFLNLEPEQRVLVCGCGYGYLESLLAFLVGKDGEVVVVDNRLARLERSIAALKGTAFETRVRFQLGDPTVGYPQVFDRIFVRGSVPRLPRPLAALLSRDGEMVVPIANGVKTVLMMLKLDAGVPSFTFKDDGVLYLPLEGVHGWGGVESLTNLESLRAGTLQVLRSRSLINRSWQGLCDRDLLPADVDIEQAFAALLDPVGDEAGFRGFAVALQGVGSERLQEFLPPPTTDQGLTDYRQVFSARGVSLPVELARDVSQVAERLGPARRIRNFMAHPNSPDSQADIKKLFRKLLGVPLPSTAGHYGRLQRVMLDEVAAAFEGFASVLQRLVAANEISQ